MWAYERENWFLRDWVCVGREEDARRAGHLLPGREELGEALVIVRGPGRRPARLLQRLPAPGHRGRRGASAAQAVRFQCPYHAWIYDLDGKLIRAKHTEDLDDFSFETSA